MKNLYFLTFLFFSLSVHFAYSQKDSLNDQQKNVNIHPFLTDRFQIKAGLYFPTKSVFISANGRTSNDMIDFGRSFDLNNSEITPILGFKWFFTKKWHLSLEYFGISNSHKKELEEDISFGDVTFNKGSYIKGGFKLNMYRIFSGREFIKNNKHDFGAGLGIHAMDIGPFIEGEVRINEDETTFKKVYLNALAPLPNLGIWYYFSPGPKWLLSTNIDWFGIEFGEYAVSLWDTSVGVDYQIFKNIGVYADYRFFKIRADVNQKNWDGTFSFRFNGPTIGIMGNF